MRDLPAGNQVPPNGVSAGDIAARLMDADDPLSFVKNNLNRKVSPEQIITGEAPGSSVVEAPRSVQQSFVSPSGDIQFDNLKPPEPAPHAQPAPQQSPQPSPEQKSDEPNPLLEEVKLKPPRNKEDSVRAARKTINELNLTLAEKNQILATFEEKLAAYESGELVPEALQPRLARVEELEQYETLHNLRLSPKYQKKYVEPIENLKNKVVGIAKEYEVDPAVLDEAINIPNKRERNKFLTQHFDDVAALEVRNSLDEITRLEDEAAEIEQQPAISFEKLQREHQADQQAKETERYEGLNRTAQQGWNEALREIKSEGVYPELVLTGNPAQDKLVKPILQAAAEEYGKFVKLMGIKKMEELPPEAAKILSKRFLLSQATGVAMASREHHYRRAEEVIENTKQDTPYMRPQVGSSNVSPTVPTASKSKQSLEEVAEGLINSVLRKK